MKGSFLSAFFLAILGLALSKHLCPPPKMIEPCECTSPYYPVTYECANIKDQETLTNMFNKSLDYPLHALVIEKSFLLYIPTALMKAKNVTILSISHSTMAAIFDEPIGSSYQIQVLQILDCSIQRGFDWSMLKGLKIEQILIERTEVKRIPSTFVANIEPTVTEITFDGAKIASVQKIAFSKLTKLRALAMPHNSIRRLQRSMFSTPSNLRIMDFSWNKIGDLPDNIFKDMAALTDVLLDGNRMKTFSSRIWENAIDKQLHQVTLEDNPIICDCSIKWYTMKPRSIRVTGKCEIPESLRDRNLIQLTPGDFKYCPK